MFQVRTLWRRWSVTQLRAWGGLIFSSTMRVLQLPLSRSRPASSIGSPTSSGRRFWAPTSWVLFAARARRRAQVGPGSGLQYGLGRRPQHARLQHGVWRKQGQSHQPDQEPRPRARSTGAGQCGCTRLCGLGLDAAMAGRTLKQASIERTLLKRACTPADIAAAIVFLCADAAMVTAQTLVVDGGYSL